MIPEPEVDQEKTLFGGDKMNCPLCGKPMTEEPLFEGLWICPDGKICLNPTDGPPFRMKCRGMYLTPDGEQEFENELNRRLSERN